MSEDERVRYKPWLSLNHAAHLLYEEARRRSDAGDVRGANAYVEAHQRCRALADYLREAAR